MTKTNLKDIPVANDRLFKETVMETKEDRKKVEEVLKFVSNFIATCISKGEMEGVMIPEFGKFRPKHKQVMTKKKVQRARENGMDNLYRALHGKPIKPKKNEAI